MNEKDFKKTVIVLGAGLAGSEAALYLANRDIQVVLVETKRVKKNPAQKIPDFAELVCTNSLKSLNPASGHGLLKLEMLALGSQILESATLAKVPAGDALAVDRDLFSKDVTQKLESHENILVIDEEASNPVALKEKYHADEVIIATGPLTTEPLANWIQENISKDDYYFYDAIAPVVDGESIDYSKVYFKDRHKEQTESADYLNIPLSEKQYYEFIDELRAAEKVRPKDFEKEQFFEACLPIDLMAERGVDTPRFSCMKPIGLEVDGVEAPFAVVQLRKENLLGSAYNMVGFQTRLKYPEQKRVFSKLPGLENASFLALGSVHRNSFLNSQKLLNADLSSKKYPWLSFAGQITGVEGYTESAACGLYVAWQVLRKLQGQNSMPFPVETAIGALVNYVMTNKRPAPSNINFGLLPPVVLNKEQRKSRDRKRIKKELAAARAETALSEFKLNGGFVC